MGIKSEFQGPAGSLSLYLGNKAAGPLGRLVCAVPPSPAFAFGLGAVPPTLEPRKQASFFPYGVGGWFRGY